MTENLSLERLVTNRLVGLRRRWGALNRPCIRRPRGRRSGSCSRSRRAEQHPEPARVSRGGRYRCGPRRSSGEFRDAAGALDSNSVALSKAIGSAYGAEAETAFLSLWREHIGLFVDYATGVAKKDKKMQDAAVQRLVAYADDFAAFLASANPNLPKDAVAGLVREHVVGLKAVVDALGKRDFATAYNTCGPRRPTCR